MVIYKFNIFNEQSDNRIDLIKSIFTYLTDEWDDMIEGKFPDNSKNSRDIKYTYLTRDNLVIGNFINPDAVTRYPLLNTKLIQKTSVVENVFFGIYIDLTGPNDIYYVLYEFNENCENIVDKYNIYFKTELITGYGMNNIRYPDNHFLILFYDE